MPYLNLRSIFAASCIVGGICVFAVSGAAREPWTTSKIQGAPEPPPKYQVEEAFSHAFQFPTSVTDMVGQDALLVTERDGKIFHVSKSDGKLQLVVDLVKLPSAGKGVTLWSAALHPDFERNRLLLICYVNPNGGRHTRVSKLTINRQWQADVDSEVELLRWPAGGHNAGCLQFGRDGLLYISTGDGAGPNPPDGLTTGQDVSDLLGAILRIDVDKTQSDRPYAIPADNPFVDVNSARPEVWAYGLRNPWKFGIDPKTNSVLVADNGWESWELIHQVTAGSNCGWPVMEGRAQLRLEVPVGPTPIQPPIKDHPHTEANSVIGGPVYRGERLESLDGHFIYGDYITGTIWSIGIDDQHEHATLLDTDLRIVDFAQGQQGEVYILDYDYTGKVYELRPSTERDTSATFPRRLSQTGLFQSLRPLTPAAGVVSYEIKAARWMDGAQGQRWIAIPGDGAVAFDEKTTAYPEGTVLVKHLTFPHREGGLPLETQLLHFEAGRWRVYSYLWDESRSEAHLVGASGDAFVIPADLTPPDGLGSRTWHANDRTECRLCHNAAAGVALGFTRHQLDREVNGRSQLRQLVEQGVVEGQTEVSATDRGRLVDPHDPQQSLDDRARSYLHANCSMCHHPRGNAIVSFYLRREMPFDKLRTYKGTGIGTFGMDHAKLIVPGDPYRSVLMYRMSKLGYGRMPYIGSKVVDSQGVALIARWIAEMPEKDEANRSAPLRVDSPEAMAVTQLKSNASGENRHASMKRLTKDTEGALAMVEQLHRRTRSGDRGVLAEISRETPSDIRGLLETFLPESQRRATLGARFDPQVVLNLSGDIARGKLIYFSDGARCRACHDATDAAKSLGPTLAEINKKFPRPIEMLQHVVDPSLKIDEKYAAYQLATDDGQVLTGVLIEQSANHVMIETADRKRRKISRASIERLKRSTQSLMPLGLLSDLTAQEAADLLKYLREH